MRKEARKRDRVQTSRYQSVLQARCASILGFGGLRSSAGWPRHWLAPSRPASASTISPGPLPR